MNRTQFLRRLWELQVELSNRVYRARRPGQKVNRRLLAEQLAGQALDADPQLWSYLAEPLADPRKDLADALVGEGQGEATAAEIEAVLAF